MIDKILEELKNEAIAKAKESGWIVYDTIPEGWLPTDFIVTEPKGFIPISNNKSFFSGERKRGLIVDNRYWTYEMWQYNKEFLRRLNDGSI